MVTAHSGALAGEDGAYEALFDAYGVLRVAHARRDGRRDGAVLEPAGASRPGGGIAIDPRLGRRARAVRRRRRRPRRAVRADLGRDHARGSRSALDPGLEAANPLDAWGTGIDADRIFIECFHALHDDPDAAALAFVVDMTRQGEPYDEGYLARGARGVRGDHEAVLRSLSNLASAVANDEAALLRDDGIPVLEGTRVGAGGAPAPARVPGRTRAAAGDRRRRRSRDDVRDRWRARLATGDRVRRARRRWRCWPTTACRSTRARAATTRRRTRSRPPSEVGWPVALKTAAPGRAAQVRRRRGGARSRRRGRAARRRTRTSPPGSARTWSWRRWRPPGVEVALGIVRDPQFGPLVLVAAGGVLVEVLHDRRLALPPLDEARARALIDRLADPAAARRRPRRARRRRRRARACRRRGSRVLAPTSATSSTRST